MLRRIAFMNTKETLDFLDQDAISAVLKGNFTKLPPEYNAQSEIAFADGRSWWQRLRGWGADLNSIAMAGAIAMPWAQSISSMVGVDAFTRDLPCRRPHR